MKHRSLPATGRSTLQLASLKGSESKDYSGMICVETQSSHFYLSFYYNEKGVARNLSIYNTGWIDMSKL